MEDRSKKLFSTILMVVGTIFIVVSGGIFVSNTWQYLPEGLKKFCLALVTAGFFGGSEYVKRKWDLSKTSFTLYYLGVCFLGYTSYSFLRMMTLPADAALLMMIGIMTVPVALHFMKNRNTLDFVLEIGLVDTAMILMTRVLTSAYPELGVAEITLPTMSFITLLLAVSVYAGKKYMEEEKVLIAIALVATGIHMVIVTCMALGTLTDTSFLVNGLPLTLIALSATALYAAYEDTVTRVFQSVALFLAALSLCSFAVHNLLKNSEYQFSWIMLLTLVINLVFMVVTDRLEMFLMNMTYVGLAGFGQMMIYIMAAEYSRNKVIFVPYIFCMCAALVLAKLVRNTEHESLCNGKVIIIWTLFGCNNLVAFLNGTYASHYVIWMWFAIGMYLLSVICENIAGLEALFRTLSLLFVYGCVISNTVPYFEFYTADHRFLADFRVEYSCGLTAVFIVLLGKIWYDIFEEIRVLQFLSFCGILAALLISNIYREALPNVLFLAIVCLMVLVLSTIFHKKNYAIASAVTLILVVLYLTKSFWLSIAWWVYLFVAGVGLILYAVKREKAE